MDGGFEAVPVSGEWRAQGDAEVGDAAIGDDRNTYVSAHCLSRL